MAVHRYRIVKQYRSGAGAWDPGQIIEVDEDFAAWLNRDVPGCVELDEPTPKPKGDARAPDAPADDRMMRAPDRKRGP